MSRYLISDLVDTSQEPNWKKVNRFLLSCGHAHDPKSFAGAILEHATNLCDFERAFVFFIDANGKLADKRLLNIAEGISHTYLESYAYRGNEAFSLSQEHRENPNVVDLILINWADEEETEFVKDYIKTQRLSYSLAMVFYDLYGNPRTSISFDRLSSSGFTSSELNNLYWAMPHLNNLHKNFFYTHTGNDASVKQFSPDNSNLTKRESEVANLLCQGVSPTNISKSLYISTATTYKHISNIYEKLGISSQRELLALMLNQ